jgi:hypothetical protein
LRLPVRPAACYRSWRRAGREMRLTAVLASPYCTGVGQRASDS